MTTVDWHGQQAIQLENDHVRIVIVPGLGAKIASLVDKTADHEWLAPPTHPVRPRTYGDTFTDHDLAGWDEMFPTIDACPSPHDPAVMLPDHGEVWALAWDILAQDGTSLNLRIAGRALDYVLTRKVSLLPNGLRLEYELENRTGRDLPFLWAAHPLFNGADTDILLPANVVQVVNAADHPRLGAPGDLLDWEVATLSDGEQQTLNVVGSAARKDYRKIYVLPDQRVSWAGLRSASAQLRLTWDTSIAPYLGIWVDEGTYTQSPTVAPEPASAYYDSLAYALELGRAAQLPAQGRVSWWLEIECTGIER